MSDEQRMREAFEVVRVAEYGILSVDRDPETGEYVRRSTYEAWGNFIAGWLARDAEVQALREALESIHYRATRWEVLPTVEAHQSVLQDIGEDALAALAGGEAGETE